MVSGQAFERVVVDSSEAEEGKFSTKSKSNLIILAAIQNDKQNSLWGGIIQLLCSNDKG